MRGPPVAVACPPDDDGDDRYTFSRSDDETEIVSDDHFETPHQPHDFKNPAVRAKDRLSSAEEPDAGWTPPSGQGEQDDEEEEEAQSRTSTDAKSVSAADAARESPLFEPEHSPPYNFEDSGVAYDEDDQWLNDDGKPINDEDDDVEKLINQDILPVDLTQLSDNDGDESEVELHLPGSLAGGLRRLATSRVSQQPQQRAGEKYKKPKSSSHLSSRLQTSKQPKQEAMQQNNFRTPEPPRFNAASGSHGQPPRTVFSTPGSNPANLPTPGTTATGSKKRKFNGRDNSFSSFSSRSGSSGSSTTPFFRQPLKSRSRESSIASIRRRSQEEFEARRNAPVYKPLTKRANSVLSSTTSAISKTASVSSSFRPSKSNKFVFPLPIPPSPAAPEHTLTQSTPAPADTQASPTPNGRRNTSTTPVLDGPLQFKFPGSATPTNILFSKTPTYQPASSPIQARPSNTPTQAGSNIDFSSRPIGTFTPIQPRPSTSLTPTPARTPGNLNTTSSSTPTPARTPATTPQATTSTTPTPTPARTPGIFGANARGQLSTGARPAPVAANLPPSNDEIKAALNEVQAILSRFEGQYIEQIKGLVKRVEKLEPLVKRLEELEEYRRQTQADNQAVRAMLDACEGEQGQDAVMEG